MKNILITSLILISLLACSLPVAAVTETSNETPNETLPSNTPAEVIQPTDTVVPTLAPPTETFTPIPPTETITPSPVPVVDSMKAVVTADKLVCRYGPGANYLYLIGLNRKTPLTLIGRAEGNSWVLIENRGRPDSHDCWVNSEFVQAEGDLKHLKVMYPDGYKIPVSPYYGPTTVLSAERKGDEITVSWIEIIVSPGKYEDENMFPYIVEVWRCENGEIIFETLGSRYPAIKFVDQAGCDTPSHGRVYIQEKHGYAGPADIPWPAQ